MDTRISEKERERKEREKERKERGKEKERKRKKEKRGKKKKFDCFFRSLIEIAKKDVMEKFDYDRETTTKKKGETGEDFQEKLLAILSFFSLSFVLSSLFFFHSFFFLLSFCFIFSFFFRFLFVVFLFLLFPRREKNFGSLIQKSFL